MSISNLERSNECYFVGTLVDVKKLEEKTFLRNGESVNALSTTIVVKSVIGEDQKEITTELNAFVTEYTKAGKDNPAYKQIRNIKDLLNQRVSISKVQISENRFFSTKTNQLVSVNQFKFTFINKARDDKPDAAVFKFSGFVKRPLHEITDANDKVLKYGLTLAQANYNGNNLIVANFIVDPTATEAIAYMTENYKQGKTVSLEGLCRTTVELVEVTDDEAGGFGEPIKKVYNRVYKDLVISHGSPLIVGDGAYDTEAITRLATAYNKIGEDKKADAEKKATAPIKNVQGSNNHLKNNETKFTENAYEGLL